MLKNEYMPARLFVGYLLISIASIPLGPWEYVDFKFWIVLGFMTVFVLLFLAGYRIGLKAKVHSAKRIIPIERLLALLKLSIGLTLAVNMALFIERYIQQGRPQILTALPRIGETYIEALRRVTESGEVSTIGQVITLVGCFKLLAIIGGFYWFSRLSRGWQYGFALMVLVISLNAVLFIGAQKAIGDILIYFFSVVLIKTKRPLRTGVVRNVTVASLSIGFMAFVQIMRLAAHGSSYYNFQTNPLIQLNEKHVIFSLFGTQFGLAIAILFLYISIGYYGLSLSIQQPFIWTYGIGGSFALASYANQYFGVSNMLLQTYPLRTEQATGWPALMYWQTIFPWLASDITYIGSLIFLALLAAVYSRAWREAREGGNILSIVLFSHLNILWIYVPANNQLMQTRESAITTIVIFVIWLIFHKRLNSLIGNHDERRSCAPGIHITKRHRSK